MPVVYFLLRVLVPFYMKVKHVFNILFHICTPQLFLDQENADPVSPWITSFYRSRNGDN